MSEQLPVIDWQQHAQTNEVDNTLSKEILTLFIEQLPELETHLAQAFAHQDREALKSVLHRLQGACAYCGLPRLRQLATETYNLLKQSTPVTPQLHTQIIQEIHAIKSELTRHGITATA